MHFLVRASAMIALLSKPASALATIQNHDASTIKNGKSTINDRVNTHGFPLRP
jgi:hypothetical protein